MRWQRYGSLLAVAMLSTTATVCSSDANGPGLFGLGFFGTVALVGMSIRIIPQGEEALCERLGKFNRRLCPGLNFVLPFVERVATWETLRECILDVPPQPCFTRDNAPLTADAVVFYRILDLQKAYYAVQNLKMSIANTVLTQLRCIIGSRALDETFYEREQLNAILLHDINQVAMEGGVQITRVEVRDITPSPEIQASMELQLAAERRKRAAILDSEGEQTARVNRAEGERQEEVMRAQGAREATVLAAKGQKERFEIEAEGLARSLEALGAATSKLSASTGSKTVLDATQVLLLREFLAAQGHVAASDNAKVFMFPSLPNVLSQIGSAAGAGRIAKLVQKVQEPKV